MRAVEFLTELFQQPKNWQWEFRGSEEAFASFTIGDIEYLWSARAGNARNPATWSIEFQNRGQTSYSKSFGMTGTGNSTEVMSTVVDITKSFLKEYGDKVLEIRFSSEGDSRTSLYAKMIKRLLPDWNLHTKKDVGETDFYLTNPKAYELNEAFDTKIPYEVNRATPNSFQASAVVGDRQIVYGGDELENGLWEIAFYERGIPGGPRKSDTFGLSGSGNELQVFSFIIAATKELIARYRPLELAFTSSKADANRTSVYSRLLKRFPVEGYTFVGVETKGKDDEFIIKRNDALDEDISRRGFLGGLAGMAAGAAAAKPMQPQQQPVKKQPEAYNVLSNNPNNEIAMLKTAKKAGLKGQELAQFMAQMKHESWDFERLKEKPQPGVQGYFAKKYDPKYAPKTAKILGNKHVGDGERYHGRGFVQLTGRDNYRMAGQALGIDLLKHPELASRPDVAAQIAVWYWNTRVKPGIQNFADTRAVTQKINPAAKGLIDRHENFKDYMRII